MLDVVLRIIEWVFILFYSIISFIIKAILKWLQNLIENLTVKIWMLIFGISFISYLAQKV